MQEYQKHFRSKGKHEGNSEDRGRMHQHRVSRLAGRIEKMGTDRYTADVLSDLGHDDTTITNLQKIAVDLLKLRDRGLADDRVKAAMSECIVVGTVSRLEYHPSDRWSVGGSML